MQTVFAAIRVRLVTVGVWALILLALFSLVSYNRATQARLETALDSADPGRRDATVRGLVQANRLTDVLTNTQNPNEDKTSDQNKKSLEIRKYAVASVARLTDGHQITTEQAFTNLFLLCKDSSDDVKNPAKDELAKLGSQSAANLHVLVAHLSDGDPDIRGAAVDALGRTSGGSLVINGDAAAKAVDAVLKDQTAQDAAGSALVKIGVPATPYLVAHLSDPDIPFRQQMADKIGQIGAGATGALPALTGTAAKDAPSVRRTALDSIANIVLAVYAGKQKDADARMAYAAQKAKDPSAKPPTPATTAAQIAAAQSAGPTLVAALADPETDSQARAQSALALGNLATPPAIAALVKVLGDDDQRVAQSALAGIQKAGPPAVPSLITTLNAGSVGAGPARAAAAEALGGIATPPALDALRSALAQPGTGADVRQRAVVGLGNSGNPAVVSLLVRSLADPDGGVASAASDALDNTALAPAAVPLLVDAFREPTPVPFNASQTLARMGDLALPALEAAAKSPDTRQQTWAAVTLGQTDSKDPKVAAILTPLEKSANPSVQFAASQALDRLSS